MIVSIIILKILIWKRKVKKNFSEIPLYLIPLILDAFLIRTLVRTLYYLFFHFCIFDQFSNVSTVVKNFDLIFSAEKTKIINRSWHLYEIKGYTFYRTICFSV